MEVDVNKSGGVVKTPDKKNFAKYVEICHFFSLVITNIRAVPLNLWVDAHKGRVFYCPDSIWEVGQ